jgi:hypothetical protein
MNQQDPTLLAVSTANPGDREITLDEMAQIFNPQTLVTDDTVATLQAPATRRSVSGTYRSTSGFFQVELRVDVDGKRPCNQLSCDFYQANGRATTYFGSCVVKSPTLSLGANSVTIQGEADFTFAAGAPVVQVTIPRVSLLTPAPNATLQFFTAGGSSGATYSCSFESQYFRTVSIERCRTSDVTAEEFVSYDTSSFPSGGPARILTLQKACAEAGVEVQVLPQATLVDVSEAGKGVNWSDAELEASMQYCFDQYYASPQLSVYQMFCQLHELGAGIYGSTFNYPGARNRQGCVVFQAGLGGMTNEKMRLQFFTCMQELGRCLNLNNSWEKSMACPPGVDRPTSLSFMNYPGCYPMGEAAFWNNFAFQFDEGEIACLRHSFRNQTAYITNLFGTGAVMLDPQVFEAPTRDQSDYQFEIAAARTVLLGEPVVLRLNLKTTDARGKMVHGFLHPNTGLVKVAIQKPTGEICLFEPIAEHCVSSQQMRMDANTPALEESCYIGCGQSGLMFTQGGLYKICATYYGTDGSRTSSNVCTLRVGNPITAADESVADLLMGEEQGRLFALFGSDSKFLQNGNKAFDEVLAKHATHPLANYVRLAKGVNAGRDFKLVTPGASKVELRKANHQQRIELLTAVEKGAALVNLDTTTVDQARSFLAQSQKTTGDQQGAVDTEKRIARKAVRAAGGR